MGEDVRLRQQKDACGTKALVISPSHHDGNLALADQTDLNHELKEEISKLNVEIDFMHNENDANRKNTAKMTTEMTANCDEKVLQYEKKLAATINEYERIKNDKADIEMKYESKCNILESMEVTQKTLHDLISDKDYVIESQKTIIEGFQVRHDSEIRILESNLEKAKNTIAQKDIKIDEYKIAIARETNSGQTDDLKHQIDIERKKNEDLTKKLEDQILISEKIDLAFSTQEKTYKL